ncbi:MAG: class I SAM-dependent methyltransferase [Candidatus Eisenbacteria bacterium]|uniref:Class I SAM-dependent methyltransferase n=1 Tax=Eiseniibacteriota bacterium TaxID=2212470 RepID=A0A538TBF2_UNCEI|nr:MAG: class I SAM-dependent methyltransferase [Candidatus Eisenbacteria bacterium]
MRQSTEAHWTRFWRERAEIEDVYSTEGRVVEEILAATPVSGKRVLEVGAGSGRDSVALAEAGAVAVLLDYSMVSLEVARRVADAAGQRVHLVRADALRMPFRDGAFHVVFHQGLLEHFRDPLPLLRENVRALGPEGILLVDVPQRFHLYTVLKHFLIAVGKWFNWMVPGLFYRSLRVALLRSRVARLPLYPPPLPVLSRLMARARARVRKSRIAFYTYFVIGALGRKERANSSRSVGSIG